MVKNISNKKLTWILAIVFVAISVFPLFTNLGTLLLRTCDESRYAANSYEMYESGNYLVTTFDYEPDYLSSKPPFVNWLQVVCFHLFGVNEFAVRFPSALAVLCLGVVLILFGGKIQKPWVGFFAALIATTCRGIAGYHAGRGGDYDAMLTLFVTTYTLSFFLYFIEKKSKYILLFFIFLSLATLTKGIQALIPIPFILGWLIYKKEFVRVLKSRFTYIGMGIFLLLIGGYYLGREMMDKGYLLEMYKCEIGGRFNGVIDGHKHPFDFFFKYLYSEHFKYYIWFLPFAFVFNWFIKNKTLRSLSWFSFFFAAFYLLVISLSETKLPWYNILALPFLSIIIGIAFGQIHLWFLHRKHIILKILPFVLMIIVFSSPYKEQIKQNYKPVEFKDYLPYYNRYYVMKDIAHDKIKIDSIVYISAVNQWQYDNDQEVLFYTYYIKTHNKHASIREFQWIKVNDYVQINEDFTFEALKQKYEFDIVYQSMNNKIVHITGLKAKEIETESL
jgi:4-amino-4-deoxy-L-arabinose transferase-like glycosyltransferase